MRIVRLHHVAFAHASDTPPALEEILGLKATTTEDGDGFVERMYPLGTDGTCLQTLEATGDGVVRRFLDRRGPGLHHLALEVSDLEETLSEIKSAGVRLIDEAPRSGGGGTRIAFIHPSAFGGLLIELVQDSSAPAPTERI